MIWHSQPTLGELEANAARDVVLSGFVGQGERTRAFENALSEYTGRRFVQTTSSGSTALQLALLALEIQSGDEIILPAMVCRAVLNAVRAVRAHPILADVETTDFTLSITAIESKLSSRTRLVLVPHMFGASADMEKLRALNVPLLEDAASSLGATFQNRPLGSFGSISVFSFASTKMITTGQGGAVLTDDPNLAQRLDELTAYDSAAHNTVTAYNYQFTDLQAALGTVQFARLPSFLAARRAIAERYTRAVEDLPGVQIPRARAGGAHCYYRFVLQVAPDSAEMVNELNALGIDARTSVTHFLYDYLDASENDFPNCRAVRDHLISLPIYPSLGDEQVEYVAAKTRDVLEKYLTRVHVPAN